MANKDFEVRQVLKAYREGIISEQSFTKLMDELCANGSGNGSANGQRAKEGSSRRMGGMNGVTGDAGLDAPGAIAKMMKPGKTFDRAAEDLGNIVALEHVNVTVPDQQKAGLFYVNGLGLTRDPYMMTGPANMWVNAGRQQFHLPTSKPQVLRGHVGVVVSDYESLPKRLERIRGNLEGTRFECCERDG